MSVRTRISITLIDVTLLLVTFSLAVILNPLAGGDYFSEFDPSLTFFILIWLVVTSLSKKLEFRRFISRKRLNIYVFVVNIIIGIISTILIYVLESSQSLLFIVYGTLVGTTMLELILVGFYHSLKYAQTFQNGFYNKNNSTIVSSVTNPTESITIEEKQPTVEKEIIDEVLLKEAGKDVYHFIDSQIDLSNGSHKVFSTTTKFNIDRLSKQRYKDLVNLRRVNDIRYINKFFESVNAKLPKKGIFIGCAETQELRKQRIFRKYPPGINLVYYILDFFVKRVFPKFKLTQKLYFLLTRGNNRVISRAEVLGRLYCCGFEIKEEKFLSGYYYFVARKEKEPTYDLDPTYGPFIKLGRTGKDGKIIKVYKIRTMHPYSEYLQEYVYNNHYLKEGGKFNNDFRVSTLGKYLRKFWIDEIPMIYNILKREMKLVGVRPLSIHYFNLYTDELQRKRIQVKPGLIPPYYADLPKTLDEIMESEMRYLEQYQKHPLRTDIKYFFLAFYNIVFKNSRSN
jgi:lipopolysaccharide/colanic/teichoic acid biosynthesis glycosyltransferase